MQPKCLSTHEKQIKKMNVWDIYIYIYTYIHIYTYTYIHTHTGILFSHKMNEILPFATMWMDFKSIMVNKTEKKEHMRSCMCDT